MILADNSKIIREKNNWIYEKIKVYDIVPPQNIITENAKNNESTLKMLNENSEVFIHSKYDPAREAETFLRQFENIESYDHILFIGTGLGYHIKSLLKNYKQIKFSIFEPNIEILYYFLKEVNLKNLGLNRLQSIFTSVEQLNNIQEFSKQMGNKTLIITLPFVNKYYSEQIQIGLITIKNALQEKKMQVVTNALFQKRWILNSLKNFPKIMESPNILYHIAPNTFKDKPVILVSAGPSLSFEIENLKYIKEHGLAFIFSVGAAINSLIDSDIIPDAACTYDPTVNNQFVFEKVKKRKIKELPLIFGSSVGFETLENFPGPLIHMITNQDTIAGNLLDFSEKNEIIEDAASIATVTLQLLLKLEVSEVILVGQNFAYFENKSYAKGIENKNELNQSEKDSFIMIEDVNGNSVATSNGYIRMKNNFEVYIERNPLFKVINTTQYGAKIKGTEFKLLESVIKDNLLKNNIVNEGWFNTISNYNFSFMENKIRELNTAFNRFNSEIGKTSKVLGEIEKTLNKNALQRLERLYGEFDVSFSSLKQNFFYSTIIEPMIRVQNEVFNEKSGNIKYEKNVRKKAKDIIEIFGGILERIELNFEFIKPIFEEFKNEMKEKGVSIDD